MKPEAKWIEMKKAPRASPPPCAIAHRIRPYVDTDEGLVYRSYLRSFLKAGYRIHMVHGVAGASIDDAIYYAGQHDVLDRILQHAQVSIACGAEDAWQVLGFMIHDDLPSGLVLHYLYVKKMFRRAGLATAMIHQQLAGRSKLVHTHYTAPWRIFARSLKRADIEAVYDPFLAQ